MAESSNNACLLAKMRKNRIQNIASETDKSATDKAVITVVLRGANGPTLMKIALSPKPKNTSMNLELHGIGRLSSQDQSCRRRTL
jgi:hypothetical protein